MSIQRCLQRCGSAAASLAVAALGVAVAPSATKHAQGTPTVPPGFTASIYLQGLSDPTSLAFGPDGRLYVGEEGGDIIQVRNAKSRVIATGLSRPLGIHWYARKLYVSWTGHISRLKPSPNFTSFTSKMIVNHIPTGLHQNDGILFRKGWMYVGNGSTCNACKEKHAWSATILRFHPDGSHGRVYATGLRNPFGLALQPKRHVLFATDNGRDDHDDHVPDELNKIVKGGDYGWPSCWGKVNPPRCRGTVKPVVDLEPHASADGLMFYTGSNFPKSYDGDAFIAEFGDETDNLGTGHIVKRIHWVKGRPKLTTLATGFENPLAVVQSPSGSLLVADFGSGIIWRIRY
jgi:glucose/arabinose dehydrogenase